MPRQQMDLPDKYCERCGTEFSRQRFNGRLEDAGVFKRRKYCSLRCANTKVRPDHWGTYHWRARKHRQSQCEACGSTESLHAHHVDSQPTNNERDNIQTLCVFCHNFLHATAARLGWIIPGWLERFGGWTVLNPSETPSSRKSRKSLGEQSLTPTKGTIENVQ